MPTGELMCDPESPQIADGHHQKTCTLPLSNGTNSETHVVQKTAFTSFQPLQMFTGLCKKDR